MVTVHDVKGALSVRLFADFDSPRLRFAGLVEIDPSQPFADLIIGTMFVVFLMMFVLIGIHPALMRTMARIREYFKKRGTFEEFNRTTATSDSGPGLGSKYQLPQLDGYEELVLRSLAQSGKIARFLASIAEDLHIEQTVVAAALESLCGKRLVWSLQAHVFGRLYGLTKEGHDYSAMQGFLPFPPKRF